MCNEMNRSTPTKKNDYEVFGLFRKGNWTAVKCLVKRRKARFG